MKGKKILFFMLLVLFFCEAGVKVQAQSPFAITEIGADYVKGTAAETGTLEVYKNDQLVGKAAVNQDFTMPLLSKITAGLLTFKLNNSSISINYEPAGTVNKVDNQKKIVAGKAVPGSSVSAYVNGLPLQINKNDPSTGTFEFDPSDSLKAGTVIQLVSENGGVKSVTNITVVAAVPKAPLVNPVSNKDSYITGQAETNSTIYVKASGKTYTQALTTTSSFKIAIPRQTAGTLVTVYAVNSSGQSSSQVTLKVLDKIPPTAPTVNKITDKNLTISGMTEPGAIVFISRNSVHAGSVYADRTGKFSMAMTLQKPGTVFTVYAKDAANNASFITQATVSAQARKAKVIMNAPVVRQMPALPRGCEVTSLTMLLNYMGIMADKMTLARQVNKDPAPLRFVGGKKYFGNPNIGFVGNMYTFSQPGFGVYNKPIEALANTYSPNRIVNLSGQSFDAVLNYVSVGHPVWVITTSTFGYVPSQYWQTWYTAQGPVRITMMEHSVMITGYDANYVYFNDPLDGTKNKRRPLNAFISGWKQFGCQAISYF